MSSAKVAAVLGVGPGLGAAIARRFAREGYVVGLMARSADKLQPVADQMASDGLKGLVLPTDASDPEAVTASFASLREQAGDPEVFVYNAGAFSMGPIAQIKPADFESAWRVGCFGALLGMQAVLPAMLEAGRGTVLITGATASLRGSARFASFASSKFALRALAQSAARELGPRGIHVAHVVVDGQIATPWLLAAQPDRDRETMLAPEAIAETYWQLHQQHPSAWTQELDVRPHVEKF